MLVVIIVLGIVFTFQFQTIVSAAESSKSQTAYESLSAFQQARWLEIQKEIFLNNGKKPSWDTRRSAKRIAEYVKNGTFTVKPNNNYFNWTETGLADSKKWDGTKGSGYTSSAQDVTIDYNVGSATTASNKIKYTEYTITNPKQFRHILENFQNYGTYVKVNLTSDLDMNGQNGIVWAPVEANYCTDYDYQKYLYIEGNGHTIYNLLITTTDIDTGAGLFSHPPAFLTVKNLGFQSSMVVQGYEGKSYCNVAGLVSAFAPQKGYFYNVHSDGAYFQVSDGYDNNGNKIDDPIYGGVGGLIGRKDISVSRTINGDPYSTTLKKGALEYGNTGDLFIKNCSTSNCYMYGKDHLGGLTSFMGNHYETRSRYDREFPENPERFYLIKRDYTSDNLKKYNYFPIMVEDCYSVDCTIFSTGSDSGAFISCGRTIVARNCFTNNTIYANDNTGGFIGRVVNANAPFIKDARGDNGESPAGHESFTIGSYFTNCYSSGIVEGSTAMGGFVGLDSTKRSYSNIQKDDNSVTAAVTSGYSRTVYENCYSTAMVGMDYAGKYCGGFIGLDDNYSQAGNKIQILFSDGSIKKTADVGSVYINCYAAGEVGNILTVTDIDASKTQSRENTYFNKYENKDTSGDILDYYPTGGFAGAIGIDLYRYTNYTDSPNAYQKAYKNLGGTGYFYNCYYDMQTTAMHEMAVGLMNAVTCRTSAGLDNFSVTGIVGLYTVDSTEKRIPGLTGYPQKMSQDGVKVFDKRFTMDKDADDAGVNSAWQYNDEYYPQLNVFMASDTTLSDIKAATATDVTKAIKASEFFVNEKAGTDEKTRAKESHPVLSLANSLHKRDNTDSTAKYAAQIADVITAYRYSQASTSTVFLDHWDYPMNTTSGVTEGDEYDWVVGLKQNRMTKVRSEDENGNPIEEWQIEYNNLNKGTYEFKIQAGESWAFNYGRTKFNDTENLVLNVPFDNCTAKIRFHYEELKSDNFYVIAEYWDSTRTNMDSMETLSSAIYKEYTPTPYTVAGSFPDQVWNAEANELYTMTYMGDKRTYSLDIKDLPAGDYSFKITNGSGWGVNYGQSGVFEGNNMSFTLTDVTDVNIKFDEVTKLCTVTAAIPDYLKNVALMEKGIDFQGYSIIFSSSAFTGYTWLPSGEEKEAAEAGRLVYDKEKGVYTNKFILPIKDANGQSINVNKNYAFKVIKDAVDEGQNTGIYIREPLTGSYTEIPIVFEYNARTGETNFYSEIPDTVMPSYENAQSYSVIGTESLTGYSWLGEGRGDDYSIEAANAGRMDPDGGSRTKFVKRYDNVPAGTHQFKVVPDTLDGLWTSPIDYGNGDGGNYIITILDGYGPVSVEIYFDAEKGQISVKTTPENALHKESYVLTGTESLMGSFGKWNFNAPVMEYDSDTGHYVFTLENVPVNDDATNKPTESYLPNINYAYKVVPLGIDTGSNQLFILSGPQSSYNVKFDYNPNTKKTRLYAYDENGKDVSAEVLSYEVPHAFYSVIGDKNLTGYDWDTNEAVEAAFNGLMSNENERGLYKKVYDIAVFENQVTNYSFKVVANGTFNSGISWGPEGIDDNNNVIVSVSTADPDITTAKLTIWFDPESGVITYELDPPEVGNDIDDSNFQWYVTGTGSLKNDDNIYSNPRVYDTVRDITSGFTFTCGQHTDERGVTWSVDEEYNKASKFKSSLEFSLNYTQEGKSATGTFNTNIVNIKVQPLNEADYQLPAGAKDDLKILAQYYVEKFMPGKEWLKVTSIGYGYCQEFIDWKNHYLKYFEYVNAKEEYDWYFSRYLAILKGTPFNDSLTGYVDRDNLIDYLEENETTCANVGLRVGLSSGTTLLDLHRDINDENKYPLNIRTAPEDEFPDVSDQAIAGSRDIRLIPTAYLEAGNNAQISVIQSSEDVTGARATNIVRYDSENSEDGTTFALDGDDANLNSNAFSYYNVGMTAAFLSTDKVGLGIYNNYKKQQVITYDSDQVRDENTGSYRNDDNGKGRYFAMSSAFNNLDKNQQTGKNADYGVSEYVDENRRENIKVGSFVNQSIIGNSRRVDNNEKGQSIVKIFKKGVDMYGKEKLSLVYVDSETTDTIYGRNYQMWTGNMNFTADQVGTYTAVFYWALSDGRYITDRKDIEVVVVEPGITKTVDKIYDTAGNNRELTYTITYTNNGNISDGDDDAKEEDRNNVNFALLDVLPYKDSTRNHIIDDGSAKDKDEEAGEGEKSGGDIEGDLNTTRDVGNLIGFNLASLAIDCSDSDATFKGIYYSTDKSDRFREFINPSNQNAAENLNLTSFQDAYENGIISGEASNYFTFLPRNAGGVTDDDAYYNPGERTSLNIDGVTALAVTGLDLGIGEHITLTYTLRLDGDPGDYLVNDAHFYVEGSDEPDIKSSDNCKYVTTTYLSRNISGYAWMDNNVDGILDADEPRLPGLKVTLYDITGDEPKPIATTVTSDKEGEEGKYIFKSVPAGDYSIEFREVENNDFEYVYTNTKGVKKTIGFKDLSVSLKRDQVEMNGNVLGSRNLFEGEYNEDTAIEGYSELERCFLTLSIPTNSQIYYKSFPAIMSRNAELSTDGCVYDKLVQNAAFTYDDFSNSVEITKVTTINGEEYSVNGVDFMLEYKINSDVKDENGEVIASKDDWYPVYYVKAKVLDGEDIWRPAFDVNHPKTIKELDEEGIKYIVTTATGVNKKGETVDGLIKFDYLFSGNFRITEVSTKNAYVPALDKKLPDLGKLTSTIEFHLPYAIDDEEVKEYQKDNLIQLSDDEDDYILEDGIRYYSHIAFKINNTNAQFDLPLTGNDGLFLTAFIGMALLGCGISFILLSIKKSNKKAK